MSLNITSLAPTDDTETKDLGPVGSPNVPVRGVMVANALAVSEEGVPLGLIEQRHWVRGDYSLGTVGERTKQNLSHPFEDKQGAYFVLVAAKSIERLGEDVTAIGFGFLLLGASLAASYRFRNDKSGGFLA